MKTATRCVHLDANGDPYGAIAPPIYQTATFRQQSASEFGESTIRAAQILPARCLNGSSQNWKAEHTPAPSRVVWLPSRR
ncbi:MAG: hypothetical protein H0W28_03525 [Pyrinomonadaceae bacterium]|nr:hypothetical protein [Pyrinomonadaceae bacterium]MBA3568405.1 hypothetical protein [Pyrinomonadaceae bacterium]